MPHEPGHVETAEEREQRLLDSALRLRRPSQDRQLEQRALELRQEPAATPTPRPAPRISAPEAVAEPTPFADAVAGEPTFLPSGQPTRPLAPAEIQAMGRRGFVSDPFQIRQIAEESADLFTSFVQTEVIPGQQQIEQRAAQLRSQGLPTLGAAQQARREIGLPSRPFNALAAPFDGGFSSAGRGPSIPLLGGRSFRDVDIGVQGGLELLFDPFNILLGAGAVVRGGLAGLTRIPQAIRGVSQAARAPLVPRTAFRQAGLETAARPTGRAVPSTFAEAEARQAARGAVEPETIARAAPTAESVDRPFRGTDIIEALARSEVAFQTGQFERQAILEKLNAAIFAEEGTFPVISWTRRSTERGLKQNPGDRKGPEWLLEVQTAGWPPERLAKYTLELADDVRETFGTFYRLKGISPEAPRALPEGAAPVLREAAGAIPEQPALPPPSPPRGPEPFQDFQIGDIVVGRFQQQDPKIITSIRPGAKGKLTVFGHRRAGEVERPISVTPRNLTLVERPSQVSAPARGGITPPRGPDFSTASAGAQPEDVLARIQRQAVPGDRPDQTLLVRHEASITTAQNDATIARTVGNQSLQAQGIGRASRGRLAIREQDIPQMDELFEALHNPSRVASGEVRVPAGFESDYRRLRELTDWEEAARIDFNPELATVEDYFFRGWKVPDNFVDPSGTAGRGGVGTRPAFTRPRANATYREMREAGFEPLRWNPYEQWEVSRLMGVRHRQQLQLIDDMKQTGLAVQNSGRSIEGWRTPDIGPAFRGKPFVNETTGQVGFTDSWVVPNRVANSLENIYGVRPKGLTVNVLNREVDLLKAIDVATFVPKRAKLFGSFFQQKDFILRNSIGTWTRMVDELRRGRPDQALRALAVWPRSTYTILKSNFSPSTRLSLRQQLQSTEPLIPGRPGVHNQGIMEAGLSNIDPTIFQTEELLSTARLAAEDAGVLGVKKVIRAIGDFESAMRRGLFEGPYPAAQITDIKNNIAPLAAREFPDLSDEALNGVIARRTNIKYSTIPASQSVFQNRVIREVLRRAFFSIGESEGLLRQAAGAIGGPDAAFWRKHWLGALVGLVATANIMHFASTGEPLPFGRYFPVRRTEFGPLPFGYNPDFASPNVPITGRNQGEVKLDLMDQMDTVFRLLDPKSFLTSRESVPFRAAQNQLFGENFFGEDITQGPEALGPAGGVVTRAVQAAQDVFSPIGPGNLVDIARESIPGGEELIPEGESRLGTQGQLVQGVGINLRAESTSQLLDRAAGTMFKGLRYDELWPFEKGLAQDSPVAADELRARQETGVARGQESALLFSDLRELDEQEQTQLQEVSENRVIERSPFQARQEYFSIIGKFAVLRNDAREDAFGKQSGDFDVDNSDPLKVALAQYYQAIAESKTPALLFDFDAFRAKSDRLRVSWTPAQRDYVDANTHIRDVPQKLLNVLPRRTRENIDRSRRAREKRLRESQTRQSRP